ncbi:MAG: CHAT domain-containing protein [Acidobacteria bacterium]|nr:CHAT domain-containing protein [Acidobacteriota bacterium]
MLRLFLWILLLALGLAPLGSAAPDAAASLAAARALASAGNAPKAAELYQRFLDLAGTSPPASALCEARNAVASHAVRIGDYPAASRHAVAATHECAASGPAARRAWNTLGQAQLYSGSYAGAVHSFSRVRDLALADGDPQAQAYAWNNLGGAQYYLGQYYDSFQCFQSAERLVLATPHAAWTAGPLRLTLANQAMLNQRLGRDLEALKLYRRLRSSSHALRPEEEAQLLANLGALYRRLGDPPKALAQYEAARRLLSKQPNSDTLLGLTKNIGIVQLFEVEEAALAEQSFRQTAELAVRTGSRREEMQAHLYLGETLLRTGRRKQAGLEFALAESLSRQLKTGEERWKALHGLARVALDGGRDADAMAHLSEAARLIEASRVDLQDSGLRSDFMSDKRRVYDDAIGLLVRQGVRSPAQADDLLRWMERSRSRLLQDRLPTPKPTLAALQAKLDPGSLLLLYWRGGASAALFWITRSHWGVHALDTGALNDSQFDPRLRELAETEADTTAWRSRLAAELLPANLPIRDPRFRNWLIVTDGIIGAIPFDALPLSSGRLVIDHASVTYLPAAALLLAAYPPSAWRLPWQRQLLALANPSGAAGSGSSLLLGDQNWKPLPNAEREARAIAAVLPGNSTVAIGAAARKAFLLRQASEHTVVHLATHAVSDSEDAQRSRLLLAGAASQSWEYLFRGEIASLPLRQLQLVTLSACETGHGSVVRGEGAQSLANAFLLAGARAAVSTLWKVEDAATAELMREFYVGLSAGLSKAEALRQAKLRLLHGASARRHPAYWSAFVLTGDGWSPLPPVVPWWWIGAALAGALSLTAIVTARLSSRRARAKRT